MTDEDDPSFGRSHLPRTTLLTADRTPKFPIAEIYAATVGLSAPEAELTDSAPRQLPPPDIAETAV